MPNTRVGREASLRKSPNYRDLLRLARKSGGKGSKNYRLAQNLIGVVCEEMKVTPEFVVKMASQDLRTTKATDFSGWTIDSEYGTADVSKAPTGNCDTCANDFTNGYKVSYPSGDDVYYCQECMEESHDYSPQSEIWQRSSRVKKSDSLLDQASWTKSWSSPEGSIILYSFEDEDFKANILLHTNEGRASWALKDLRDLILDNGQTDSLDEAFRAVARAAQRLAASTYASNNEEHLPEGASRSNKNRTSRRAARPTTKEKRMATTRTRRPLSARRKLTGTWTWTDSPDGNSASATDEEGRQWTVRHEPDGGWTALVDGEFVSLEETKGSAQYVAEHYKNPNVGDSKSGARRQAESIPDTNEEARTPDEVMDVTELTENQPADADDSQYDPVKYDNQGGKNLEDSQAVATPVEAMMLTDAYLKAGLASPDQKYQKMAEFQKLPSATVRDRLALLSAIEKVTPTRQARLVERELPKRGPRLSSRPKRTDGREGDSSDVLMFVK